MFTHELLKYAKIRSTSSLFTMYLYFRWVSPPSPLGAELGKPSKKEEMQWEWAMRGG